MAKVYFSVLHIYLFHIYVFWIVTVLLNSDKLLELSLPGISSTRFVKIALWRIVLQTCSVLLVHINQSIRFVFYGLFIFFSS